MKLPLSWLRDFIDLEGLSIEEIARTLTLAGLEVEEILYVGLPPPQGPSHAFKFRGLGWEREKIVVAEIREVQPHPNADRLVLCQVFDGREQHTVLTGAPNLFEFKGKGKLPRPLKAAYAREGATLYDGHAEGRVLMRLKRQTIRGVESYSMLCSEKELGISEEHEGIIILDEDAPPGMPLADYMGDAVLEIDILPNMARNASVVGVARELAALTGRRFRPPRSPVARRKEAPARFARIEIREPALNPRFVLGLIREVEIKPSPYSVQRRLRLAGMRPINNIVDATNYAMLELGEPLHAFDYDVLRERAGKGPVKIITRPAREGETLVTLDGVQRRLSATNVLVCDEKGPLSIAGVMGGAESEVTERTRNVLLEGAAWNFINIRRTAREHNLPSEASFRFARGVHPALAEVGVRRGLELMAQWSGGVVEKGLVDQYPLKFKPTVVELTPREVKRLLGIDLTARQIANLLGRLEFQCKLIGARRSRARPRPSRAEASEMRIRVTAPPHRLDIGEGIVGVADVVEEIARLYGYERIPEARLADALPPQVDNPAYEWQERLRDRLVALGFQEIVSYRLTSPEREGRLHPRQEYVRLANPISPERRVLRRSLVASLLDILEHNIRLKETLAFFEIGPVFEPRANDLPQERLTLALAMSGLRQVPSWDVKDSPTFDFYDLKGRLELLLNGLRYTDVLYLPTEAVPYLHPGKAAEVRIQGQSVGVLGELHPLVKERYEFGEAPVLVAELDLEHLRALALAYAVAPVPEFPPVYEDIAIVVDEAVPASRVEALIRQSGGASVANVRLFDVYRGEQIGAGKKSLAYSLTYQALDRTLTDAEAASIRTRIVRRLEAELGARLRG